MLSTAQLDHVGEGQGNGAGYGTKGNGYGTSRPREVHPVAHATVHRLVRLNVQFSFALLQPPRKNASRNTDEQTVAHGAARFLRINIVRRGPVNGGVMPQKLGTTCAGCSSTTWALKLNLYGGITMK